MRSHPLRKSQGDAPEIVSPIDRRGFELRLEEALAVTLQLRSSLSLLLVAIDRFTVFARSPAPQAAEAVLAAAVERIGGCLRSGDKVSRVAADRLAILLMECDEEKMAVAASRFIDAVSGRPMVTAVGPVSVRVAIGGIVLPRQARNAESAFVRAEMALAEALVLPGPGRFSPFFQRSDL